MAVVVKQKRPCHLGTVIPVAIELLVQVFEKYIDAIPVDQDELIFDFGSYVQRGRSIYEVVTLLKLQTLELDMMVCADQTRFLSSQLKHALVLIVSRRSKRKIYTSKKFPVTHWAAGTAGGLMDLVADARNLSYRKTKYDQTVKKLLPGVRQELDLFLDKIVAIKWERELSSELTPAEEQTTSIVPSAGGGGGASSSTGALPSTVISGKRRRLRKGVSEASAASALSVDSMGIPKMFAGGGSNSSSEAGEGEDDDAEAFFFQESDSDDGDRPVVPKTARKQDTLLESLWEEAGIPIDPTKGALKKLVDKKGVEKATPKNESAQTCLGPTTVEYYSDVSYITFKNASDLSKKRRSSLVSSKNKEHVAIIGKIWKYVVGHMVTKPEMEAWKKVLEKRQKDGLPIDSDAEVEGCKAEAGVDAGDDDDDKSEPSPGRDWWDDLGNSDSS